MLNFMGIVATGVPALVHKRVAFEKQHFGSLKIALNQLILKQLCVLSET